MVDSGRRASAEDEGQCQRAASDETQNGHREKQTRFGNMGHQRAAEGHGDGADDERPRGKDEQWTRRGNIFCGQPEKQVHRAETKEGDVTEAIHPAFEARVASKPVLAMKEHPQHHAGDEAEQYASPGRDQV